eukprot:TRINITY_DN2816_c0_g1_i5.p1 TRINITY_DN2816_c0_g1~~TRINITY_DN2816_c0_g1_i5.p1  ORF type:complete len:108 (+),score=22.37 TRINITY_DN2816_c0_g1_i5:78-401(+)
MGGVDETGPILFHMDPSGTFLEYKAMAIGAGSEGAQQHLEKEFYDSLSLDHAKILALQVLKQVMEEKLESHNIEIGVVSVEDKLFRHLTIDEIEQLIAELKPVDDDK